LSLPEELKKIKCKFTPTAKRKRNPIENDQDAEQLINDTIIDITSNSSLPCTSAFASRIEISSTNSNKKRLFQIDNLL
jgi:hypothetical protein